MVEADLQLGFMALKAQHLGTPHQAAQLADAQAVAHFAAVDFLHVDKAAVAQHDAVSGREIGLFQ
ncbi:hypothetical protein D3C71_1908400 [compost metagenome]